MLRYTKDDQSLLRTMMFVDEKTKEPVDMTTFDAAGWNVSLTEEHYLDVVFMGNKHNLVEAMILRDGHSPRERHIAFMDRMPNDNEATIQIRPVLASDADGTRLILVVTDMLGELVECEAPSWDNTLWILNPHPQSQGFYTIETHSYEAYFLSSVDKGIIEIA